MMHDICSSKQSAGLPASAHVLLNNVDHKDLRINRAKSKELGDNVMSCIAYFPEFRNLQSHYPIVFSKNPSTGQVSSMALLGFEKGENLFLSEKGWDNDYVPMALAIQPFLIGYENNGGANPQTVIHIDMNSPRISDKGEPVFLPMGGHSPYLEHISEQLSALHSGHAFHDEFIYALEKYDLLEPFSFEVELNDNTTGRLSGFHIINEQSLYALSGSALEDLNTCNFLSAIYMAVSSLSNFTKLVKRKNDRIGNAGTE